MGSEVWEAHFPWEGTRLLDALQGIPTDPPEVEVLAYVSESPETRAWLGGHIAQHFALRAQVATVRVRSAYKPGLCWLSEEVMPLWRRGHADRLVVRYPVLAGEGEGRFLQELYPLAALLEREGVQGQFQRGGRDPVYQAALFRGDTEIWRGACPVPLAPRTSPDGRAVHGPTGWLTVRSEAQVLHDAPLPTDGELFWDWYGQTVLPRVLELASARPGLPAFRTLRVTARLSEPDLALNLLSERLSMTEALEEEVYFGTLDALKRHTDTPAEARHLQPGQIVPAVVSGPGQDGWARVKLALWDGEPSETEMGQMEFLSSSPLADRPRPPEATWALAHEQARRHGLDWTVPARSVQGRPVPAVLRRGTGGVLVTGGQHANEATGPVAAVELIGQLAATSLPFAVLPLENPDGAHLHRLLCRVNPEHMHHAARYTALGDDLEARQRAGQPRWETRARVWAAGQVGAALHLNLHGYPAHEWVRPYSGYAPHGFESWALPVGFLTIVWHAPGHDAAARALAESIAARLVEEPGVLEQAQLACRTSATHSLTPHYELIRGLPFLLAERPGGLCPLTVITEAPDETIYGADFALFVRAHLAVGEAAICHITRGTHDQADGT